MIHSNDWVQSIITQNQSTAFVSGIGTGAVGPNGVQSAPCWCPSQVTLGSRRAIEVGITQLEWATRQCDARRDSPRRHKAAGPQLYSRKNRRQMER